ncbi:MAG: hypothetical protein ABIK07_26730 [Planctomycetota bacterium]
MSDIPFTEIIQHAYARAKKAFLAGQLPISEMEDLCHVAYVYAFYDLNTKTKEPDYERHYAKSIDELYKLFDRGELDVCDTYAAFAFCYLKVYEIEGVIPEKSCKAQFEYERKQKF